MATVEFSNWLQEELQDRGWSQLELSRRSGISPSQISRVLAGERGLGEETLKGIAKAFKLPPETVYRAAGLLPPKPALDEQLEHILHEAAKLSPEDQAELLAYIRMKRNLREKRK